MYSLISPPDYDWDAGKSYGEKDKWAFILTNSINKIIPKVEIDNRLERRESQKTVYNEILESLNY
jgi:hypothetical protein